ncbi:endonuclease domain-containing protein [Lysobacter sp. CFH 32150]|uniref:endonuclease domain-containing protein n=1 Tax=Lysobacter sp. CFH 32150 TaxID=2927128 RepID=UPI001FA6F0C5|nr:endonuclease domain-containing protein [Lysobacter sp. CFH 32150]MCI4569088.1 endonuclease domain-containing protein [Lysobacter sp. CFH 32150]
MILSLVFAALRRPVDQCRFRARDLRSNATDAERHLWQRLRMSQIGGYKFRRQVPIGGYIADFVCPQMKLIIELDGGQHAEQTDYDLQRSRVLLGAGFRVVRYWNDDVLLRTEDVLDDILRALESLKSYSHGNVKSTPPQPSPSLREREGAKATAEEP